MKHDELRLVADCLSVLAMMFHPLERTSWRFHRRLLPIALAGLLISHMAIASETVHFESAVPPPSALKIRLAQESGEPVAPEPAIEIGGELYRPDGDGPFPAIVVLHGSNGRALISERITAARFISWGYVYLAVDSFGSRSESRIGDYAQFRQASADVEMDALGALEFLATKPFINADHVGVLGFSFGGGEALQVVSTDGPREIVRHQFKAAIAYYPSPCAAARSVAAPTLILVGELDDAAPASVCRGVLAHPDDGTAPVKLVVYPDAYHDFDKPNLSGDGVVSHGRHYRYNEAADHAAVDEVREFVRQKLGQ